MPPQGSHHRSHPSQPLTRIQRYFTREPDAGIRFRCQNFVSGERQLLERYHRHLLLPLQIPFHSLSLSPDPDRRRRLRPHQPPAPAPAPPPFRWPLSRTRSTIAAPALPTRDVPPPKTYAVAADLLASARACLDRTAPRVWPRVSGVPGVTGHRNPPGTRKPWTIAHDNGQKCPKS